MGIWMCRPLSQQIGFADSQGLGKQETHKQKLKLLFTKYPSASVNVLMQVKIFNDLLQVHINYIRFTCKI